jgi:hypothetical protein
MLNGEDDQKRLYLNPKKRTMNLYRISLLRGAVIVLSPKPLVVASGYLFPDGNFSLRFVSQPKEVRHVQVKY